MFMYIVRQKYFNSLPEYVNKISLIISKNNDIKHSITISKVLIAIVLWYTTSY